MTSSPASDPRMPDIAAIRAAATRIAGQAVLTPLLESPAVNARLNAPRLAALVREKMMALRVEAAR